MATIFRAPLFVRRIAEGRAPAKPFDPPNLLLGTLKLPIPSAAKSFLYIEWPQAYHVPTKAKTFEPPNLLLATLKAPIPSAAKSFLYVEFPASYRILYKAAAFDAPNLLPLLAVPPAPVPFANYEWPRASMVAKLAEQVPPNLLLTTLATKPFTFSDWQRAAYRSSTTVIPDPPNLLLSTLASVAANPFANYDYPRPAQALPRAASFDPPNLLASTLFVPPVVSSPFFQTEWPNAKRHDGTVPPTDLQNLLPLYSAPAPAPIETPTGGHWLPPTREELARQKHLFEEAQRAQEQRWAERLKDQQELHQQIMDTLHPERVIGLALPPVKQTDIAADNDEEDDIEFLLLNG